MRKIGFQLKLTLVFIVVVLAVLSVTTFFEYRQTIMLQKQDLRARILGLAKTASLLIDGDQHSQIIPEITSSAGDNYKHIKQVLRKIRAIDPLIDSVYTMVKSDKENIWMFVVDSGDRRGRSAYCGERYDVSGMPQMRNSFEAPGADQELTTDKWGVWLSGYAPIYNHQGKVVAIVGLDVSAASIKEMQLLLTEKVILVFVFGLLLALFLGWFIAGNITHPLHDLILGVREVERGNLWKKVDVKSHDEIKELADDFNKMTEGLVDARVKLQAHYLNTIKSLAKALDAKDPYTRGHSDRVAQYAVKIAKQMHLSQNDVEMLEELCILHDIGKIGVSEQILGKPSALSDDEFKAIQAHPEIGAEIIKNIEFLRPGLSAVLDHHERFDGKGYPRGLKADEISIFASIVSVADSFDAMTSDRPYRQAFSQEKAIQIIKENSGTQFNPRVVRAFLESFAQ